MSLIAVSYPIIFIDATTINPEDFLLKYYDTGVERERKSSLNYVFTPVSPLSPLQSKVMDKYIDAQLQ